MSSYGHHPAPGYDGYDSYRGYEDTYTVDSYGADPYLADPYGAAPARASAAVGSASAGRASVAAPTDSPRPRYDWSGGQRQAGSAAVGSAPAGRASVPVSPATGAATGRATVRPGGPTGPGGPGGTGPSGAGGARPARKKKRHWLRNSLLIALAVLVITTGGGMVGLSYYVDSVPPPELVDLAEGSTVRYANGKQMATLQDKNREIIDTTVPELANVRNAVIAAEDKDFYSHSGVDFVGIVRAAWNNVTGGSRQGASTIDQQYTRAAADLYEDSYSRKLKEAAMAYKLNQEHAKDEILDFYLNTIYFGRGAYGIQAAAEAYFGKPAAELSVAEAAVIAGTIRIPDDGSGLSPYDPRHPENAQVALDRWNYVLGQLVETGKLDPAQRAELTELPETVKLKDTKSWHEGPQGPVVKQVRRELEQMGITDVDTGGYRITTTIDPKIQNAALDAARRTKKNKAEYWQGVPKNVKASTVAIDPATGAVLAYYGGEDGAGVDLAGPNYNEKTKQWEGGWPPGSTFKIYTLIAELREGISFETHWQTSPYQPDWMDKEVHNAGRIATSCEGSAPDFCTLRWSTQQSFNVPFAHFSEAIPDNQGPARIVDAAMDAGITMLTDDQDNVYDLTAIESASEVAPEHFFHPVAYGQYKVTTLDHASGVATIAASGVYHQPHFVKSVEQKVNGEWQPVAGDKINGEQRIEPQYADAITGVLSTIPGEWGFPLEGGRPAAAKTGTWEHPDGGNRDAWVVGYTPQIATAVWVGDPKRGQIKYEWGEDIGSSDLPADIWRQFMNQSHAAKEYQFAQFPTAPPVGDPQHPLANGEAPAPDPPDRDDDDCRLPIFCDDNDDDDDNDNGGGNDGDDGDGNTGTTILPTEPPDIDTG